MQITEEKIREIAGNLDVGLRCFYHLKTGERTPDKKTLLATWYSQQ